MAPKAEWAVVVAALALAVPLWRARDRAARAGDVVEEPITLVPEDKNRLACLLDHRVGPYTCAFRTELERWNPEPAGKEIAVPCMTTARKLYLVAGLFDEPSVSHHVSRHYTNARFTARCKLRLVSLVTDYKLRFANDAPWGREGPIWLAEPLSCTVE